MNSSLMARGELAPDFELQDVKGRPVRLSSFRRERLVVLAFLRGFF